MTDNRTTEKLMKEFVAVACECEVRDYLISEYAERIEQAIAATLGSGTKLCYATDYTHEHCKYSVNRGWVEDVAHGMLTTEQVRRAIYASSAYTSYDGCTYHASGINLQEVTNELNAEVRKLVER